MRGRFTAIRAAARVTAESERAQLKTKPPDERDVRALTEKTEAPVTVRVRVGSRSLALGNVRKVPAESRRLVLSGIVSSVSHCHARGVVVSVHAELTRVSLAGDVRISVDLAPNARYTAPETIFAGLGAATNSPTQAQACVAWSLACLLMKLITGTPLVHDDGGDGACGTAVAYAMSPAQLARVLCVVGALRVRDRDDDRADRDDREGGDDRGDRDDREDRKDRKDRADRECGEDREGREGREGGEGDRDRDDDRADRDDREGGDDRGDRDDREGGEDRADRDDREGGEDREGCEGSEGGEGDRDRKNGHKGLSALFDALDATKWRNRAPKLKIPRNATARERELLRRSLRWTDRPHLDAFCMARGARAHAPTLGAIAE
jgi:hypothetical protein